MLYDLHSIKNPNENLSLEDFLKLMDTQQFQLQQKKNIILPWFWILCPKNVPSMIGMKNQKM